jgi:hypothetical protein
LHTNLVAYSKAVVQRVVGVYAAASLELVVDATLVELKVHVLGCRHQLESKEDDLDKNTRLELVDFSVIHMIGAANAGVRDSDSGSGSDTECDANSLGVGGGDTAEEAKTWTCPCSTFQSCGVGVDCDSETCNVGKGMSCPSCGALYNGAGARGLAQMVYERTSERVSEATFKLNEQQR